MRAAGEVPLSGAAHDWTGHHGQIVPLVEGCGNVRAAGEVSLTRAAHDWTGHHGLIVPLVEGRGNVRACGLGISCRERRTRELEIP